MKVLVTGGGGFIGSNLAARLLADGHEVRVLDNFATGLRENLMGIEGDLDLVEGDVQSYERVYAAVRDCEVTFHQAALPSVPRSVQDPLTTNATNVVGTLNVLLASRDCDVRRVVFASSSSIYGSSPALPKREDQTPAPRSPYAVAKLAGEGYCRSFSEVYGLDTVSLRYFNVFGPRQDPLSQYSAVIPNFISAALTGQQPRIFGDGEQTRDFTYVDNTVEANILAMTAEDVTGEILNIACNARISLNHVLEEITSQLGVELEPMYEEPRTGDVRNSLADISRAREVLAYRPTVDFREGIGRTIEWFERSRSRLLEATTAKSGAPPRVGGRSAAVKRRHFSP
jgi:UDP-glucose 4-epimerase